MINLAQIRSDFPDLNFSSSSNFVWSSINKTVYYNEDRLSSETGSWSLLHELGHAVLGHKKYRDDLELLILEVMAWSKAKELAKTYELKIDNEYIDNCIETYRNWIHKRSKCYNCDTVSLQSDIDTYICHNCHSEWQVPVSKLCKVRKKKIK